MSDMNSDPIDMKEPETFEAPEGIWKRGLWMFLFLIFFGIGEALLAALTIVQFFWMLFAKERNVALMDFGKILSQWLKDVADFQSGNSDTKPFPCRQ